jgi:hypothetical protein
MLPHHTTTISSGHQEVVISLFVIIIQQNDQDMAQMLWLVIDLQMDLYYHSLSLFVRASSSVVVACPLLLGWIGW